MDLVCIYLNKYTNTEVGKVSRTGIIYGAASLKFNEEIFQDDGWSIVTSMAPHVIC